MTERHRTLAAAIEWSYRLLEDDEKRAFVVMSVFRGGCTVEALTAVAGFDAAAELESLLDKSLIYEIPASSGEPRYRFSDPTREFAIDERSPNSAVELGKRHYDHFAESVLQRDETIEECHRRITGDLDNIRASLEWSLLENVTLAARLALSLSSYWRTRSMFTEARLWFERARASAELERILHADLARHYAAFSAMQHDYDAAEKGASEALENYRELNDERGIGSALHTLAEVEHRKGNFESANSLYQEAFVHLTAAQHSIGMVYCLSNRGLLARQRGDLILADNLLKEAGQQAEILRDTNASAQIMIEQAWLSIARRRPGTAEQLFRDAARRKEDEGDAHGSCQARLGVGTSLLIQEHYAEARQVFEQALRDAHSLRARIFIVDALFGMSAALTGIEEFKAAIASFVLAESTAGALSSETFKSLAREIARKQISAVLHQDVEEWSRHGTCDPYRDPETTLSNIRALVNRADN